MIEAARADVYAQLLRQIKGMEVSDDSLVADHVMEQSDKTGVSEGLISGVKLEEPRFFGDICMMSGSITLAQVVDNVNTLLRQYNTGKRVEFESLKRRTVYKTIRAEGVGTLDAPNLKSATDEGLIIDTGLEEAISQLQGSGKQRLGAIEAARIDALSQLARQIKGIEVSDQSLVQDMVLDSRWTTTSLNALVKGAVVERYVALDGDLVSCVMRIYMKQIEENLRSVSKTYSNGKVDFREFAKMKSKVTTVRATGYGAIADGRMTSGNGFDGMIGSVK